MIRRRRSVQKCHTEFRIGHTPGEAPLTFNERFEIRADTQTVFTADFAPVKRGRAGGYVLQPVPDGITVEYEENA